MSDISSLDELLTAHRKEKKELVAKTQKMKHEVPKGDKKKKKDVTAEIAQLLADLDIKHENELKEFEKSNHEDNSDSIDHGDKQENGIDSEQKILDERVSTNDEACEVDACNEISKAPQRVSKAQKRRNKKAALEKERCNAIAEQELQNLNGLRHLESEQIKKKLSERNLSIYEIPSDGNCLYKAVEHQLSLLNLKLIPSFLNISCAMKDNFTICLLLLNILEEQMNVQTLREETSHYMLSHVADYIPFLTSPDTGDVLSEDLYKKYCEDIAGTTAWGGHIEVQALSQVCGVPIEIIQAQGPSIVAGDEKSNPKLVLCYHRHVYSLGEHYNSVIPVAAD